MSLPSSPQWDRDERLLREMGLFDLSLPPERPEPGPAIDTNHWSGLPIFALFVIAPFASLIFNWCTHI